MLGIYILGRVQILRKNSKIHKAQIEEKYTKFRKEMLAIVPSTLSMSKFGSEFCLL